MRTDTGGSEDGEDGEDGAVIGKRLEGNNSRALSVTPSTLVAGFEWTGPDGTSQHANVTVALVTKRASAVPGPTGFEYLQVTAQATAGAAIDELKFLSLRLAMPRNGNGESSAAY